MRVSSLPDRADVVGRPRRLSDAATSVWARSILRGYRGQERLMRAVRDGGRSVGLRVMSSMPPLGPARPFIPPLGLLPRALPHWARLTDTTRTESGPCHVQKAARSANFAAFFLNWLFSFYFSALELAVYERESKNREALYSVGAFPSRANPSLAPLLQLFSCRDPGT